jgi:hypothetical protein
MGKVKVRFSKPFIEQMFQKTNIAFRVSEGLPPDSEIYHLEYNELLGGVCTFAHPSFEDAEEIPFVGVLYEALGLIEDDEITKLHDGVPGNLPDPEVNDGDIDKIQDQMTPSVFDKMIKEY